MKKIIVLFFGFLFALTSCQSSSKFASSVNKSDNASPSVSPTPLPGRDFTKLQLSHDTTNVTGLSSNGSPEIYTVVAFKDPDGNAVGSFQTAMSMSGDLNHVVLSWENRNERIEFRKKLTGTVIKRGVVVRTSFQEIFDQRIDDVLDIGEDVLTAVSYEGVGKTLGSNQPTLDELIPKIIKLFAVRYEEDWFSQYKPVSTNSQPTAKPPDAR